MSKIIITADSTFDMTPDMAAGLNIEVIPSYVSMGGDNIADYPDVTMYDLFAYHDKSGRLPKTAAAAPWDYTEFFRQFEGCQVLHIAKSSKMSACRDNALIAAQDLEGVHIYDSLTIAGGSAMLAVEAARLRDEGRGIDEIINGLDKYREKISGAFIVDQLEYLHKGGRCSALANLGANILKLRPQIIIQDGAMVVGKKYRGRFESCMSDLIDDLLTGVPDGGTLYISHTVTDPQVLQRAIDYAETKARFEKTVVLPAGSAVSCHCGPNTFGMFVEK